MNSHEIGQLQSEGRCSLAKKPAPSLVGCAQNQRWFCSTTLVILPCYRVNGGTSTYCFMKKFKKERRSQTATRIRTIYTTKSHRLPDLEKKYKIYV